MRGRRHAASARGAGGCNHQGGAERLRRSADWRSDRIGQGRRRVARLQGPDFHRMGHRDSAPRILGQGSGQGLRASGLAMRAVATIRAVDGSRVVRDRHWIDRVANAGGCVDSVMAWRHFSGRCRNSRLVVRCMFQLHRGGGKRIARPVQDQGQAQGDTQQERGERHGWRYSNSRSSGHGRADREPGAAAFTNAYGRKTEYRCPRWDP